MSTSLTHERYLPFGQFGRSASWAHPLIAEAEIDDETFEELIRQLRLLELRSAWRDRRQDEKSPPPKVVETPAILTVGNARPLTKPVNQQMQDRLEELKDLAAQVKDGAINPDRTSSEAASFFGRRVGKANAVYFVRFRPPPLIIKSLDASGGSVFLK